MFYYRGSSLRRCGETNDPRVPGTGRALARELLHMQGVNTMDSHEVVSVALPQLQAQGVAVIDGVFGAPFAQACRAEAQQRKAAGELSPGQISVGLELRSKGSARGDLMMWIKPTAPQPETSECKTAADVDSTNAVTALDGLMQRMQGLRDALCSATTLDLDGSAHMLACYPGGGERYVRHRDAAPVASGRPGRKLTVLYYLNTAWCEAHGGQLRIWPDGQGGSGCSSSDVSVDGGLAAAQVMAAPTSSLAPAADASEGNDSIVDLDSLLRCISARASSSNSESAGDVNASGTSVSTNANFHVGATAASSARASALQPAELQPMQPMVLAPIEDRMIIFFSVLEHEVLPSLAPRFAVTTWLSCRRDQREELLVEQREHQVDRQDDKLDDAGGSGAVAGNDVGRKLLLKIAMRSMLRACTPPTPPGEILSENRQIEQHGEDMESSDSPRGRGGCSSDSDEPD